MRKSSRSSLKNRSTKSGRQTPRKNQSVGERDARFGTPTSASDNSSVEDTGFRRSSRQTKSKESQQRPPSQTFDTRNIVGRTDRRNTTEGGFAGISETTDTFQDEK